MIKKIIGVVLGVAVIGFLGFWLVYLPSIIGLAQRHPAETNPASLGMRYEDVAFPSKGHPLKIRGWWLPAESPRAVLIFVHGASGNRREIHSHGLELAKFLVSRHISVLTIDLRNHGTSDGTPSGRLALGYGESDDVLGAVAYASSKAPGLPVYLMGSSMGGAAVVYAAAFHAPVKGLVLLDPVLDPHTTSINFVQAVLGAPRWFVVPMVWSAETFFSGDPGYHDPLVTAETLKLPILLIQDDRDPVCLPATAAELARANSHVTLWVSHDPPKQGDTVGWGYHTAAYVENPLQMQAQLTQFLHVN